MFTQCSKCDTVFRLSAEALRAASGQVRCGRCGDVFNALARLAEESTAFSQGESAFDLESRADEILQSLESVPPVATSAPAARAAAAATASTDIAQLQVLEPVDEDLAGEASLEFTLPPGELDRIFIETPKTALQRLASGDSPQVSAAPTAPEAPAAIAPPEARVASSAVARQEAHAASATAAAGALTRVPGLEVSEDVRRELLSSYAHAELPEINAPRRHLPLSAWVTAAALLALALAAQVIQSNSEWLTSHASRLGLGSAAGANLAAYQLRQWGVTGDPAAKGTLRVRASIMNTAAQLQPYPLLRVTLANRFGTRVGAREFEPAEYLGKPTAHLLGPGERVDATLDILDPGKDAEGFEIDVCVRRPDKKIICAGDAGAETK